ncbi:MAG TPA: hypothetical protein VG939_22000 [Caulobacteraceae bacterium]|nr:hypothetical protein [Caulobacteraceae bacterium]
MRVVKILVGLALAAPLGACILPAHEENAALKAPRPAAPPQALLAYASPSNDYPTVGGNTVRGEIAMPAAPMAPPVTPPSR